MARKVKIPADLPADAFGFVAAAHDRPERRALYRRDGVVNTYFGFDTDDARINEMLERHNLHLVGSFVVPR